MLGHKQTILAALAATSLGACSAETSSFATAWNQPAGAFLDEGGFGNPTMQNMMAQMVRRTGQGLYRARPDRRARPEKRAGATALLQRVGPVLGRIERKIRRGDLQRLRRKRGARDDRRAGGSLGSLTPGGRATALSFHEHPVAGPPPSMPRHHRGGPARFVLRPCSRNSRLTSRKIVQMLGIIAGIWPQCRQLCPA